jgi:hypothetical protein
MSGEGLPDGLDRLFSDSGAGRVLDVDLPPGRLVVPYGEDPAVARPAYWLSDGPADPDFWVRLHHAHPRSGLWPVLADPLDGDPDRPWVQGEVTPQLVTDIDDLGAFEVLKDFWLTCARLWGDSGLAPFSLGWPGLALAGEVRQDPDVAAGQYASSLGRTSRIVLVAAARGADVLTAAGWEGPLNHSNLMAPLSSVLRSWEDRFGARVVRMGFATLELSVAAPPMTAAHAQRVAAEHYAFCPEGGPAGVSGGIKPGLGPSPIKEAGRRQQAGRPETGSGLNRTTRHQPPDQPNPLNDPDHLQN